jgi:hypothetical protein
LPEFTAEFITAISLFITTVVGAVITLRREFHKVAVQNSEIHTLVNSQHTEVKDELAGVKSNLSDAKSEIQDLKDERNHR